MCRPTGLTTLRSKDPRQGNWPVTVSSEVAANGDHVFGAGFSTDCLIFLDTIGKSGRRCYYRPWSAPAGRTSLIGAVTIPLAALTTKPIASSYAVGTASNSDKSIKNHMWFLLVCVGYPRY